MPCATAGLLRIEANAVKRIVLADVELALIDAGHGEAVLFVHGLGGSHSDWRHQIEPCAHHFRVLVPDLRGFGASSAGTRRIDIPQLARDLLALLDALGIERCHLVGHSMGGAVALQLALDAPQRVGRLVIANSVPSFSTPSLRRYGEFLYRLLLMATVGPVALAHISARRMFPGEALRAERARVIARSRANRRWPYLQALLSISRWSVRERLPYLQLPALVIAAEHDYFAREESERFAHALPHAEFTWFPGAHHALPSEQPDAFNARVCAFLDGGRMGT